MIKRHLTLAFALAIIALFGSMDPLQAQTSLPPTYDGSQPPAVSIIGHCAKVQKGGIKCRDCANYDKCISDGIIACVMKCRKSTYDGCESECLENQMYYCLNRYCPSVKPADTTPTK